MRVTGDRFSPATGAALEGGLRPMNGSSVWVVDDDQSVRDYLLDLLTARGHKVSCVDSGEQFLIRLEASSQPSLLLLDIRMPMMCGLEVLCRMREAGVSIPSIVLSGDGRTATVVEAMRLGAIDYLVKPVEENDLDAAMVRALASDSESDEECPSSSDSGFRSLNRRMQEVRAICDKAAPVNVPILILGESGVGKEVLARYIHSKYNACEPFVKVNCAALPSELLESELFGYERGAYTGAMREKPGKFEMAGRGTVMLDEIAEMSPLLQAKLLHVLQDGEYYRLGGTRPLTSEARIIAATNKNLETMVANGSFREDLYFRLNVINVEIPPLRERREDIPALCSLFVERYRTRYNSAVKQLPKAVMEAFLNHQWPGNVRELENAVKRFLILPELEGSIPQVKAKLSHRAAEAPARRPTVVSLKDLAASASDRTERELVFRTLNDVNWNRKAAALRLGICYKSLLNKLHRWQASESSLAAEHGDTKSDLRATA